MEHDAIVESRTGYAVAWVHGRRFSEETDAANLAFIVEAVNAHAALVARVAALEMGLRTAAQSIEYLGGKGNGAWVEARALLKEARHD